MNEFYEALCLANGIKIIVTKNFSTRMILPVHKTR